VFDEGCSNSHPATASYAEAGGDAHAYRAESASDIKSAVQEILSTICP